MANPIPGYTITTPYGKRGSWQAGYHTGDDYSTKGKTGVKVRASRAGKVVGIGSWGSSYGIHIILQSGAVRHGYCHLSRVSVKVGQNVKVGQQLGLSGNTGNSTGPHLHYEERNSPYGYYNNRKPQFNR